ncbi:MAG TPA: polysaccharide biosynthesis/export family protein [Gemmataceae bacterium]|nr:polysaccharide biosynthesis/export family protein [Gemmataceae bacterium]
MSTRVYPFGAALWAVMGISLLNTGCLSEWMAERAVKPAEVPKELKKVNMPEYIIEPPDLLLIDAVRLIPKAPYRLQPLDTLLIRAVNVLPTDPIENVYGIETDGQVNLGFAYGAVPVAGLTLEEAQLAVLKRLKEIVRDPQVTVSMASSSTLQQIRGEHLVRPDGTVGLGNYGTVYVTGKTLVEAKIAIEKELAKKLEKPEIAVDVYSYNSKNYYIITDNGGFGEGIVKLPITGNETVLDALAQIGGVPSSGNKCKIWIARPSPDSTCAETILNVDYPKIAKCAATATNYQIFPGDRLYVDSDPFIKADGWMTKIFQPVERVFGIYLLGQSITNTRNNGSGSSGNASGF